MNLVENRLVDTAEEDEGGTNWGSSIDIYALSCVKQMVGSCWLTQEVQAGALRWPREVGWGQGTEAREGRVIHIIMMDSHCCTAETNRTKAIFHQLKKRKKKTNVDFSCHIPDVQIRIYILTLSPDGCVCILKFENRWINDITYIKHLIQCWHVVNTQ